MANKKLKVMIVDDTAVYRKILKDLLRELDSVEVSDSAFNGDIAMRKIETNPPDVVILDLEMPGKDGLETLSEIKEKYPQIGVIVVSGVTKRQSKTTMEALRRGAFDFIPKPLGSDMEDNVAVLRHRLFPLLNHFITHKIGAKIKTNEIIRHIQDNKKLVEESKVIVMDANTIQPSEKQVNTETMSIKTRGKIKTSDHNERRPLKIDVLCVGISTGGPGALHQFIPYLPKDLGVPVLLVQHMPADFTKSLAEHLNLKSNLTVVEAIDGQHIKPNTVFIAPGGKHMIVEKKAGKEIISITDTPPVQSCKPSVDVLFESIPKVYPGNILAVVMTGMGCDGLGGVKKLQGFTHYCLTQSEESCVVYGMPKCIDEAGLSDESVHLNNLAQRVTEIVKLHKFLPRSV